jgi:hypothetical protein
MLLFDSSEGKEPFIWQQKLSLPNRKGPRSFGLEDIIAVVTVGVPAVICENFIFAGSVFASSQDPAKFRE